MDILEGTGPDYLAERQQLVTALRQLRQAARLSTYELAERLGWSQSKITKIEHCRTPVTAVDVQAIAAAVTAAAADTARRVDQAQTALTAAIPWPATRSSVDRDRQQQAALGPVAGMDHRQVLAAFVVLVDASGRVLLAHRRDVDVWDLPGGRVEAGETPWQAAVRETMEETGLAVEVERLTGLYGKPGELVAVFRGRVEAGTLRPTLEADLHAWLLPQDLPPNISPNQVERIRDALTDAAPALRIQPGYSAARPQEWLPARYDPTR